MQPQRPRPRVKWTSSALEKVREEVGNQRGRFLQALNVVDDLLPREAEGLLGSVSPEGYPNCFLWSKELYHAGVLWRLDCIVSKAGWSDVLWVFNVFARTGGMVF